MTRDEATALIDTHLEALGEHFDSVQILVSNCDYAGTSFIPRGCGNFYARKGMAQTFVERDVAEDSARYIARELNPED